MYEQAAPIAQLLDHLILQFTYLAVKSFKLPRDF
jgi:hypothetical protein